MSLNANWVPMKWPCGPLEIARLNEFNIGDADLKKTAEAWTQPSSLLLLKGTPVNCLVVDWALGTSEDAAQQLALRPLIHAGRQLGISFVGNVSVKENLAAIVAAGRAAGLEAVILQGSESQAHGSPLILQFPSDNIEWDITTAIFIARGGAWPKATMQELDENMDGDTANAGPTGNPWADSNGWLTLLARQMASGKVLWLDIDPPDSTDMLRAEDYCLAIADSRVYGSHWVISLENTMRTALMKKNQSAMDTWTRICETLSFFESHAQWDAYDPMGVLAVVSDFRGQNAYTSGQVLNLLDRRQIQFVIIDRMRPLPSPSDWQKGILWLDDEPPNSEQKNQLLSFVQRGGLVIAAKYWGPSGVTPYKQDWLYGYNIYNVVEGRIVVAEGGLPDPFQLSRDAHLLVSRKNDFVRLYNPGTTKYYSCIDSNRSKQVVQILNYSTEPASYVTLWINTNVQEAKLWLPAPQASVPVQLGTANEGTNVDLPPFSVNSAVEFERLVRQ